jgi:hypothetical protein
MSYTTVSISDALSAVTRGTAGAAFLLACAQTPVYSVPASAFMTMTAAGADTAVTVASAPTSTTKPATVPPTLEEFNALPTNKKIHWECLHCGKPALGDAYTPGSYCSQMCAYYAYM